MSRAWRARVSSRAAAITASVVTARGSRARGPGSARAAGGFGCTGCTADRRARCDAARRAARTATASTGRRPPAPACRRPRPGASARCRRSAAARDSGSIAGEHDKIDAACETQRPDAARAQRRLASSTSARSSGVPVARPSRRCRVAKPAADLGEARRRPLLDRAAASDVHRQQRRAAGVPPATCASAARAAARADSGTASRPTSEAFRRPLAGSAPAGRSKARSTSARLLAATCRPPSCSTTSVSSGPPPAIAKPTRRRRAGQPGQQVRADVALEVDREIVVAAAPRQRASRQRRAGRVRSRPRASQARRASRRASTPGISCAIASFQLARPRDRSSASGASARTERIAPSDISRSPMRSSRRSRIRRERVPVGAPPTRVGRSAGAQREVRRADERPLARIGRCRAAGIACAVALSGSPRGPP